MSESDAVSAVRENAVASPAVKEAITITTPAISAQRQTAESVGLPEGPVPDSAFTWGGYFQAIGILLVLLLALWYILRLVRRVGGGRFLPPSALPRQSLRTEAQLALGRGKGLVVVRFLNKRLLLGVTEQQINLLTEMEIRDEEFDSQYFQKVMDSMPGPEDHETARRPVDSTGTDTAAGSGSGG